MDSLSFLIFSCRKPISGVVRRTRLPGGKISGLAPFTPLNPKMTAVIRDNCKGHLQALSQEHKGSIVCPH